MKRLCVLLAVLLGLGACRAVDKTDTSDVPTLTEPEETTTQTGTTTIWIFDQGPNWKNFMGSHSGDHYAVYDNEGNEFFRSEGEKIAEFTMIDENLLRADSSGGNVMKVTRFFDVEQGLYSPQYINVLGFGYGRVAYWDIGTHLLIVHNMFDAELNRNNFQRDFATGPVLPIEVEEGLSTFFSVQTAEFIDENSLFITYYNSQSKLIEETLSLKETP